MLEELLFFYRNKKTFDYLATLDDKEIKELEKFIRKSDLEEKTDLLYYFREEITNRFIKKHFKTIDNETNKKR